MNKKVKLIIISDGTGETASGLIRAAMAQFDGRDIYFTRYKNIRTKERVDGIFIQAALKHDMIAYTIVNPEIRDYIAEQSRKNHVRSLDLMGPALTALSNFFEIEPDSEPGALRQLNENYFKRVEAMEFTLNHDDGRNLGSLHLADVILVGISRTSKTPLSVYLSQLGLKVVNVPLVQNNELPKEIFEIDQRKIFALTINPDALWEIRKNRIKGLGAGGGTGNYAAIEKVIEEVEWANQIFKENKRWPVFNITDKALEETATEILKIVNMRKKNLFKQAKRS